MIVVDNGGTDRTEALARQHGVLVVHELRGGVCRARQQGPLTAARKVVMTDTVGLVLLEAVALDRPVVAVGTRASRDTVADYSRARLVAVGAPAQEWRAR